MEKKINIQEIIDILDLSNAQKIKASISLLMQVVLSDADEVRSNLLNTIVKDLVKLVNK